jgi:hypothetical protein
VTIRLKKRMTSASSTVAYAYIAFLGLTNDAVLFQLQSSYRVQDGTIKNGEKVRMWRMANVVYLKTLS